MAHQVTWSVVSRTTRRVLFDLSAMHVSQLPRFINKGESVQGTIPVTELLAGWEEALHPRLHLLVASHTRVPFHVEYVGYVTAYTLGSGSEVTVDIQPLESAMNAWYPSTYTASNREQTTIAAENGLSDLAALCGGVVRETASGVRRDRTWRDIDDVSAGERVLSLTRVIDGLEWRIAPRWAGPEFACDIEVAATVGRALSSDTGLPMLAPITDIEWSRTFSRADDDSATKVTLSKPTQGNARVVGTAIDNDLLTYAIPHEYRRAADSGTVSGAVLTTLAQETLSVLARGRITIDAAMPAVDIPQGVEHIPMPGDWVTLGLRNPDLAGADRNVIARLAGTVAEVDEHGTIVRRRLILTGGGA